MTLKALFVDDDEHILASLKAMLHSRRKEWTCRFAPDPLQGLRMIEEDDYDVVLADMRMPFMDGADFLEQVEVIHPDAVRIILSGFSESQSLLKSARNAHQFLSKPTSSETITNTIERVMVLRPIITDESIRSTVTGLDSLPTLPDLFISIKEELEGPDPDLQKVAEYVEQDVGMSATLMKLVNSSFFGFYAPISSPGHAVVLLGVEVLKGLVLGISIFDQLNKTELAGFSVKKLWDHCLETGVLAKTVASCETKNKDFISNCFTAGFLHDIGKLVFASEMEEKYSSILESVRNGDGPVIDAERRQLDATHADVGAYLLGLWGFNEEVVEGIHNHHDLERSGTGFTTAAVVHVAEALQHELAPRNSGHTFTPVDETGLQRLRLDHRLEIWREKCSEWMTEEAHGRA